MVAHDTSRLLRRSSPTVAGVRRLALLEGATHTLLLDDRSATFYRTLGGTIEAATAIRDDDTWTLSHWIARSVPRLPSTARPLKVR